MTTIAWDGKILAADTQTTCAAYKTNYRKISVINDRYAVAVAGEIQNINIFNDWIKNGLDSANPPKLENSFGAILVDKESGFVYEVDNNGIPYKSENPFIARGSGEQAAMALMSIGKSAVEAVEITADIDIYTGKPVDWVQVFE